MLDKLLTDSNGRFVLISGTCNGNLITFLNVYAPNSDEPSFMSDMVLLFNENCKGFGVMGGDFNVTLGLKDKSNQVKASNPNSSKVLRGLTNECGLTDVWREFNQETRDYTFYSHVHNSYSRLDYLFVPSSYLYTISKCHIHPFIISDHSRIQLTVQCDQKRIPFKRWRLHPSLLKDNDLKSSIRKWLLDYTKENVNPSLEPNIIWEAAKATLRGQLISYAAFKNREKLRKRKEIEKEIMMKECLHKSSPTEHNWLQLTTAKAKLNTMITEDIVHKINFIKQNDHEFGNKPGKLLAYQIKKELVEKTIKAIHVSENKITYHPLEINQSFFNFYSNLYISQESASQDNLEEYLRTIKLPEVSISDQQSLNSPFTEEEVLSTINSMPLNKSPGPDGFSVDFYKEFWPEIQPIFMAMVNQFSKENILPQTMNLAYYLKVVKTPYTVHLIGLLASWIMIIRLSLNC